MFTMENLPDILYFASPRKQKTLKGKVFLTPYLGIASIFIIDRRKVMDAYFKEQLGYVPKKSSYNLGYSEWEYHNSRLQKPLTMVNIKHNIPDVTGIGNGVAQGYIHVVDISSVKDKLHTFVTNDPDREVIYEGKDPLLITNIIPHEVQYRISFDITEVERFGKGRIK